MAIRARVELKGSLTHMGNGRTFVKGNPQILTSPSDIQYYQGQADFSVIVLEAKKSKVRVEDEPEPEVEDVNETEEDEDDEDYEEDDEVLTEEVLDKYKKADLKNLAAEMGLDVNGTKNELIERILNNQ